MERITILIPDMHCAACSTRVEKVLKELQGVSSAVVNLATFKGSVEYDKQVVGTEQLLQSIRDVGFTPELILEDDPITRQVFLVEGMT